MSSLYRVATQVIRRSLLLAVVVTSATSMECLAADETPELDPATREVQGKWTRVTQTPNGPVRLLKEHRGHRTLLAAYDQKGNVLYAHESEFRIEIAGKVRILTFFNRKVTAGPDKGQEQKESQSFLYRISGDQFIETWGLLENDPSRPLMILWKRPDDRALGNEPAVFIPQKSPSGSAR